MNRLVPERLPEAQWGIRIVDAFDGEVLADVDPDRSLSTASVAKVLTLLELSARVDADTIKLGEVLDRREVRPVHDSGLWQHLTVDRMPIADVATLIGTVSDNLATNVLLECLGLEHVQRRAAELMPGGSTLHDIVRDTRGPEHPEQLSTGTARDWSDLMAKLAVGQAFSPATSHRVMDWLANSVDHSMVAGGLGLDPLSHGQDRRMRVRSKTGTDAGVRCDVGVVTGPSRTVAYAVLANWDPADELRALSVCAAMRQIGAGLRVIVSA